MDSKLEQVIKEMVAETIKEELKPIIHELMPDIDQLIANKVKQHFLELAEFITGSFSIKKE